MEVDEEWDLCTGGFEHEFKGNSRICYYCDKFIPPRGEVMKENKMLSGNLKALHDGQEQLMNPVAWTYVYWNLKTQEREQLSYETPGEALGAAYNHLDDTSDNYRPIEIWHKGWIMYDKNAIWAKYQQAMSEDKQPTG